MRISSSDNSKKSASCMRGRLSFARSRSGQAAMEFLMTYGWAILVVLAAIAALAYFGVLSPEKFLPEKCILEPGMFCVNNKVEPAQTTLILLNSFGRTITVNSVTAGGCSTSFDTTMLDQEQKTFVLTGCSNGAQKEKFKGDISIKYTDKNTNLTKTMYGNLNTKVE